MAKSKRAYRPKEIYYDGKMHILWYDGAHTSHGYWDLRTSCPCASCVNEVTGEKMLDDSKIDKAVRPLSSEYVGNYALAIQWSDSHSTGIYTFKSLRDVYPHETETEAVN